jgi:hypothetical protein
LCPIRLSPRLPAASSPTCTLITFDDDSSGDPVMCIRSADRTELGTIDLRSFWSALGPDLLGASVAHHDPVGRRWVVATAADPAEADAALLIGVTRSEDPYGDWLLYRIEADHEGLLWAMDPTLGFNRHWVTVQVNRFRAPGVFVDSSIYVFGKAELYGGGAGNHTRFSLQDVGASQVPALTYDGDVEHQLLVGVWNGALGLLRAYEVCGSIGGETLTLDGFLVEPEHWPCCRLGGGSWLHEHEERVGLCVRQGICSVVLQDGCLWIATEREADEGACTQWRQCLQPMLDIGHDQPFG